MRQHRGAHDAHHCDGDHPYATRPPSTLPPPSQLRGNGIMGLDEAHQLMTTTHPMCPPSPHSQMRNIGIMVLDEAHHCDGDHPYALLLREFWARAASGAPLSTGVTAAASSTLSTGLSAAATAAAGVEGQEEKAVVTDGGQGAGECLRPRLLGLTASPVQVRGEAMSLGRVRGRRAQCGV